MLEAAIGSAIGFTVPIEGTSRPDHAGLDVGCFWLVVEVGELERHGSCTRCASHSAGINPDVATRV